MNTYTLYWRTGKRETVQGADPAQAMTLDKILDKAIEFETKTGKKPTNVYMGRLEMAALVKWAQDNVYIGAYTGHGFEGAARPEVNGLFVYEVNADSHLECS